LLFSAFMVDRERLLPVFEQALRELNPDASLRGIRPRGVAVRAHGIYCAGLRRGEKRPCQETFRKFATGRLAIPEIVLLLKAANVRAVSRARLDRQRLREVFQEAIQRLEARLIKGQTRPLQIARRAHEIYTRDAGPDVSQPSHHTFQRLIYGKGADPEIMSLIDAVLKRKV
jgi:hypothetical protein